MTPEQLVNKMMKEFYGTEAELTTKPLMEDVLRIVLKAISEGEVVGTNDDVNNTGRPRCEAGCFVVFQPEFQKFMGGV